MATSGLTIELNNFGSFKKQLNTLDKVIKSLDATVDSAAISLQKLDTGLAALAKNKSIKPFTQDIQRLANGLKKINDVFGGFSAAGGNPKVIQNVIDFSKGFVSAVNILRGINVDTLKPALTTVKDLTKFIAQLSGLGRQASFIDKIFGRSGGLTAVKSLSDFMKGINDAIGSLGDVRQPQKLKAVSSLVQSLSSLAKILSNDAFVNLSKRDLRSGLKDIEKIAKSLGKAMQSFEKIRRPDNINSAADATTALVRLIKVLSGIDVSSGDIVKGDRLSKYLLGIRRFTKILAESLKAFDSLKSPGNVLIAGQAINSIAEFINSLRKIRIDSDLSAVGKLFHRGSPLLQAVQGLRPVAKIIAESLASFDKIGDPTKVASVGFAIQAIAKALPALFAISSNKKFPKEIKNNIAPAIRELGKALSDAAKKAKDIQRIDALAVAFERLSRSFSRFALVGGGIGSGKKIAQDISQVIDSIEEGFTSGDLEKSLLQSGEQSGKSFLKGIKKTLEIASPSRAMIRIAGQIGEGLVSGLKKFDFLQAGATIAKAFVSGFAKTVDFLFNDVIRQIGDKVNQLGQRISQIGQTLTQSGRSSLQSGLTNLTAGGLLGFLGNQNVNLTASFDQILNQIRVFGNLSRDELSSVQDAILDFSARTIFDPTQSVQSFLAIQKAGLDAAESLKTLNQAGDLAAAGDVQLDRATNILLRTMGVFNLTLEDQTRIINAYVRGANNSTASVDSLAAGMENVGPLANAFGLSLEQVVAILALFDEAGIVGAEAGTQLKSVLTNLTRPTDDVVETFRQLGVTLQDDAGNIKDFNTILNELNQAMNETKTITYQANNLTSQQSEQLKLAQNALAAATRQVYLYQEGLSTGALGRNAQQQLERYQQVQVNAQQTIAEILGSQSEAETITREITRTQFENFQAISKLAGSFGQAGLTILLANGEDAINGFVDEMNKLPDAATIASELMDTFSGSAESLRGSVQTLTIKAFTPLLRILNPFVQGIIKLVDAMAELPEPVLAVVAAIPLIIAAFTSLIGVGQILFGLLAINLGAAFTTIGFLVSTLGSVLSLSFIPTLLAVGVAIGGLVAVMTTLATVGGLVIGATIKALSDIRNNVGLAGDSLDGLSDTVSALFSNINGLADGFIEFVQKIIEFKNEGASAQQNIENLENAVEDIQSPLSRFIDKINALLKPIRDLTGELKAFFDFYNAAIDEINGRSATPSDNNTLKEQEEVLNRIRERVQELKEAGSDAISTVGSYSVKAGDTLYGIAAQYGIDVEELARINNLSIEALNKREQFILTGQNLVIPGQGAIASDEELENLNRELALLRKRDRLERDLLDSSEETQTQQNKNLTSLQKAFTKFAKTNIFKRLFGDDEKGFNRALGYIGIIQNRFESITDSINGIGEAFLSVFDGDINASLRRFGKNIGNIFYQLSLFAEDIFGVSISDRLQEQLSTGNFGAIIGDLIKKLFETVGKAIADNVGDILSFAISTPLNIPLKILDFLGFADTTQAVNLVNTFADTVGSAIQAFVDVLRGKGGPEVSKIDFTNFSESLQNFKVGGGGFFESFTKFKDDVIQLYNSIANNEQFQAFVDGLTKIMSQNISDLAESFGPFKDDLVEFLSDPAVQDVGKILAGAVALTALFAALGTVNAIKGSLVVLGGALKILQGLANIISGLIDVVQGDTEGGESKLGKGLNLIGEGLVKITSGLTQTVIDTLDQFVSLLEDLGLVKYEGTDAQKFLNDLEEKFTIKNIQKGLKDFFDSLSVLPTIFDGLILKLRIALQKLDIEIIDGLNKILEPIQDLASDFGIEVDLVGDTTQAKENLAELEQKLREYSVGLETLSDRVATGELGFQDFFSTFIGADSDIQQQIIDELTKAFSDPSIGETARANLAAALSVVSPEDVSFGGGFFDIILQQGATNLEGNEEAQKTLVDSLFNVIKDAGEGGFSEEQIRQIADAYDVNQLLLDAVLANPDVAEGGATFSELGLAIVDGTIVGIQDNLTRGTEAVTEFSNSLIDTFRTVLAIQSPSAITKEFGLNLVTGLTTGMIENIPLLFGPVELIKAVINSLGLEVIKTTAIIGGGFFSAALSVESAAARMVVAIQTLNSALSSVSGNAGAAAVSIGNIGANVPTVSSSNIPGRQIGGSINPNQFYEINEPRNGVPNPEMLTLGNRNFLISPTRGFMKPLGQAGNGGNSSTVVQQNVSISVGAGADSAMIRDAVQQGIERANQQSLPFIEKARIRGTF